MAQRAHVHKYFSGRNSVHTSSTRMHCMLSPIYQIKLWSCTVLSSSITEMKFLSWSHPRFQGSPSGEGGPWTATKGLCKRMQHCWPTTP